MSVSLGLRGVTKMGHPIPRISTPSEKDVERRAADRVRLFERGAIGLAPEGKNPLQNMALHRPLSAEELKSPQPAADSPWEKPNPSPRDVIGRGDALPRSVGAFAAPDH